MNFKNIVSKVFKYNNNRQLFFLFLVLMVLSPAFGFAQESTGSLDSDYSVYDSDYTDYTDYVCYPDREPDFFDHHEIAAAGCRGEIQEIWDDGCGGLFNGPTHQCGLAQNPVIIDGSREDGWSCECSASQCYNAPEAKDVRDDTLSPKNVFENNKLKLPVNLGWNDVNKWAQDNSIPAGECKVESYRYEVYKKLLRDEIVENKPVLSPSADPVLEDVVGQCTLEPANSYQWRVHACRDAKETDCTKWSKTDLSKNLGFFTTSLVPELLSPFDEDFEDKEKAGIVTSPGKPLFLEWCPLHEIGPVSIRSYKIEVTLIEGGEEQCHPSGTVGGITCPSFLITSVPTTTETGLVIEKLDTKFQDLRGAFTKGVQYFWSVAACLFESGHECTSFSQKWSFEPVDFPIGKTELADPPHDPSGLGAVGFPVALKWTRPFGINSFQYEITPVTAGKAPKSPDTAKFTPQSKLYSPNELSLDAFYKWRVRACTDIGSKVCEDQWTKEWIFKTTGIPPQELGERDKDEKGEVIIPAILQWKEVPGAASYRYELSENSSFTPVAATDNVDASAPEVSVDYPKVRMNKDYWWHVKTCADTEGNVCGAWSSTKQFHTFTLKNPQTLLVPTDGGEFWTYQDTISWEPVPGAKAYHYKLVYGAGNPPDDEKNPSCKGIATKETTPPDSVTDSPSIKPELRCLGSYTLELISCLDKECKEKSSSPVSSWTFNYVQPAPSSFPSLIPCGKLTSNNPHFSERDKCEFKHIFLLIRNLVDFALWKLSLIIVIVMVIVTAAIMFFSFGGVDIMAKVRTIWKAIGIGVLILLFSWLFLNILLDLVGFDITFYGKWYELGTP